MTCQSAGEPMVDLPLLNEFEHGFVLIDCSEHIHRHLRMFESKQAAVLRFFAEPPTLGIVNHRVPLGSVNCRIRSAYASTHSTIAGSLIMSSEC